jgi:type III pantothenate kinase
MLLAIDIGNTDVVIGVWHQEHWAHIWRIRALPHEQAFYYETRLRNYFLEAGLRFSDFNRVVVSSVVPPLTGTFREFLSLLFGFPPLIVTAEFYSGITVKTDKPHELGSDLFANAVAVYAKYKQNCVVVDFGTALTFTSVSANGQLLGVAIAPGLRTAMKALSANTAQLPEIPLELPASVLGKNTVHAMQAGILLGYVGLVESLLERIREEMGGECIAIATGGLSSIIEPLHRQFNEVNKNLTLDGLRIIGEG